MNYYENLLSIVDHQKIKYIYVYMDIKIFYLP